MDRLIEYTSSTPWSFLEILVVDDGSKDGTAKLVASYAAKCAFVQLLQNPGNRGKGYAVRNGMLKAKGEWRLFTDSDLSAPIEEVEKLFDAVEKTGVDAAFGSRALDRSLVSVHQSLSREWSGRFFNLIMRAATGLPHKDTQCGFKLYSAKAAEAVFTRQTIDGFGSDVENLFVAKQLGFRTIEVPVRWANVDGTRVGMMNGFRAFYDLAVVRRNQIRGLYR